ncbi:MAG TPA: ATP synthase F0 subunit B [Candidatus Paceibacterota bacterium]|jgi:F-type H+-transporting ATPase subunit b|nr:ATP synthase F0 subunit B [Candidatus Paceibacterota bacterium]
MAALFGAFGLQLPLLIAQAVNFAVLMAVLWYLLYKPVMKTIEVRRVKVAQGVLDAEAAAEKLAAADGEATATVQQAEKEAEGIVASAREEAGSEKTRIVKEADARAAAIAADADARAKETAAKALRESEKEIARLAVLAAEKAMRKA